MEFFKQYIKVISNTITGLVFIFASFYLLANCFHYMELRKDYVTNFDSQAIVTNINDSLDKIEKNISGFNVNNYNGNLSKTEMNKIKQNIQNCVNHFKNETITNMHGKNRITIVDVYNLRESYENDILNGCVVNNLYFLTTLESNYGSKYLYNNKEMIKLYINSLVNATSYLKKDLLNNSSYFYNTSIADSSVKSNTKDGFDEVMSAYNKACNLVLFLSDWFKTEMEG